MADDIEECNWLVGFRFLVGQFTWFLEDHCNGLFPFGGVGFEFKDCSKYEIEVSDNHVNTFLQYYVGDTVLGLGLSGHPVYGLLS